MTGLNQFEIVYSEKFCRSVEIILKTHYKKSESQKDVFKNCIGSIISDLENDPNYQDSVPCSDFGSLLKNEEYRLRKLFFDLPFRRGASGEGRILYIVDHLENEIELLWVYTHEQYQKQPPYQDIKYLILEWLQSRTVS